LSRSVSGRAETQVRVVDLAEVAVTASVRAAARGDDRVAEQAADEVAPSRREALHRRRSVIAVDGLEPPRRCVLAPG